MERTKIVKAFSDYHHEASKKLNDVVPISYKGINPYSGLNDDDVMIFSGEANANATPEFPSERYLFAIVTKGSDFAILSFGYLTANITRNEVNRLRVAKAKLANMTDEEKRAELNKTAKKLGLSLTEMAKLMKVS